MESIHGFDFFRLSFDADGKLQQAQALEELKQRANAASATDAILIAHGFRNDENDATGLYTRFLQTLRQNLSRPELQAALAARKFVVAGVGLGDGMVLLHSGTRSSGSEPGAESARAPRIRPVVGPGPVGVRGTF